MKKILLLMGIYAAALLFTQSAHAVGIGVYGTGGVNFSTLNYKETEITRHSTDYFYGGGLVVDSNVARNELFNYRFTAGYEQYQNKPNEGAESPNPRHRFSMTHTFGFGIARNDIVRFWIGPRIGLHYTYLRDTYTTDAVNVGMGYLDPFGIMKFSVKEEIDVIGFDALLAMGININMGNLATLFFDIGVGYMGNYNINVTENGHGFGIEGKIGFMFRIRDTYRQTTPTTDIKIQVQDRKQ